MMSSCNLPPLRNLPSWSRVGTLDRARFPPRFPCECQQKAATEHKTSQTGVGMDRAGARVSSLERDIQFLQQTHKSTLEKLHEEIDHLKRANKELQYQLIMGAQHLPPREPPPQGLREKQCQARVRRPEEKPETGHHGVEHSMSVILSLLPLRIQDSSTRAPRSPTLQECEAMIRQLYNTNTSQSQELLQLKAVLRDLSNKKKLSPEVYNLTKTNRSDNTSGELTNIPKVSLMPLKPLPKIQHQTQVTVREKVILPAIRQTLSSNLTERQKRAQDIHKLRLRRAIFS
ncbi:coiled-coil domain-containing protein 74A isoform X2 [Clarias gariepinus]|uniref:coiled-coil domain-containing protein 74A isoform X2 n=1 Tax=Clarias gariepinus TaxID=13013 RepID=UPI00234D9D05|nr:coiled-coil domain-containing protein 74A isoform X2 [Clarias gariepinus]